MTIRRSIFILALVIVLGLGFGIGILYAHRQGSLSSGDSPLRSLINQDSGRPADVDFSLFWQIWSTLHEKYVDQGRLGTQKLVYGAIAGMVNATGDPYTTFFEPVESKKFQEEIAGSFSGVGMEVGKRNNVLTVITPIKDTPAFRAGIKAGDVVVKIDGQATADMSVDEAVTLIRGKRGTSVALTIARNGESEFRTFTVIRETIRVPTVSWTLLDGHVAYLQIFAFNQTVDQEFVKAIQQIQASAADRIIVDLRNNPGGLLDSAVNIAGWFLAPNSVVVREDFGDGVTRELRSEGTGVLQKYPTVFLLNGGSASASEILAGALHDLRKTPIVGEKSFGKGSVQELENYTDGSSLKVTVAKWLTPAGISISEKGIEASVPVAIDPKAEEDGLFQLGKPGADAQLDAALKVVKDLRP